MKDELKVQVVMLPTERATRAYKNLITHSGQHVAIPSVSGHKPTGNFGVNELVFVSKQPVRAGEWLYDRKQGNIFKAGVSSPDHHEDVFKIECTTDPTLKLPFISDRFLRKFVKSGGSIKEVIIEMTESNLPFMYENVNTKAGGYHMKVKIRPDGTCITHPVINRMYSEAEVRKLMGDYLFEMKCLMGHRALYPDIDTFLSQHGIKTAEINSEHQYDTDVR